LLLPSTGRDRRWDFAFIAHETSHQWWGDKVRWRSYRDQWLSEGFAEYSGVLYTGTRMKPQDELELIKEMRTDLMLAPRTDTGLGAGKLYEVGPLRYGYRLESRLSRGAYTALVYDKGALVLRMLHFLLTDPKTGNGNEFFDLMKEFTDKYQGRMASTTDFMQLAEAHYINSPIGKGFQMKDLNWFMNQWVYGTEVPNYRLEYRMESKPDGGKLLTGTLFQYNVPKEWFMPLPLEVQLSNGKHGMAIIYAYGPSTPVKMQLPPEVEKVELDPELFILSGKTTAEEGK
jgi:aminopeptidase N